MPWDPKLRTLVARTALAAIVTIPEASRTSCHLCGARHEPLDSRRPALVRCRKCGVVSLGQFPEREELDSFYQDEYYDAERGERFSPSVEWILGRLKDARVRGILRRVPGPGALLDVGCGRGDLLERFEREGWRAVGTQISRTAADAARRIRGVDVRIGELPDMDLPESSFDAVTLFHVLEHLPRPAEYLERARDLLRDGGLLVVEVPDCGGPGFRLLRRRSLVFDYPHHLTFFTRRSLGDLVRRCGFRVEGTSGWSVEYSPFTTLQNILNVLPGEPNRLYRALRRTGDGRALRRSPWTVIHAGLASVLAVPALLISMSSLALPCGNTVRLYARKRAR